EAYQLPLTVPRTHPVAAREAARASRLAHNNSAKCRLSTTQPGRRARLLTADVRRTKVLGYPAPEYEHHHRREPEDARTAPQAATTSTITTTNQTMAIHPYPLTPAPPYGRRRDRPAPGVVRAAARLEFAQQDAPPGVCARLLGDAYERAAARQPDCPKSSIATAVDWAVRALRSLDRERVPPGPRLLPGSLGARWA